MNIEKSKKLLKKIDRLLNNLVEDGEEATASERKLLISYLHDMEDIFSEGMESTLEPEPNNIEVEVVAEPKELIEASDDEQEASDEEPIDEEPETETLIHNEIDLTMEEIFDFKDTEDLSGKFASSAITDLRKAMGLNEKILTINELFNGNATEYEQTMAELNDLADFDAAKQLLVVGAAKQYEWSTDKKKKKAIHFLKLIRRRYN